LVSLLSFVGVVFLALKERVMTRSLLFMVSFATGAILGDIFLHLLPEAFEGADNFRAVTIWIFAGLMLFFVVEKFIQWRHCHIPTSKEHPHSFAVMNLVGDAIHNLLDGVIIAGAYLASIPAGIATTVAVLLHEIPQEIGDFGVLVHGGFSKTKALLYNFLSALTAILGALLTLIFASRLDTVHGLIIPIAIGALLYIGSSDMMPELRRDTNIKRGFVQLTGIALGVLVMVGLLFFG
jgi:zinc and cadmium transporter